MGVRLTNPVDVLMKEPYHFMLYGPPGVGKGQPLNTPLPSPSGWLTYGELEVGTLIYDHKGCPTKVTGVYDKPVQSTYRVHFKDGTSTVVDGDHLWTVFTSSEKTWKTLSTRELQPCTRNNKSHWRIPASPWIQYPTRPVNIDPYELGLLLGNGGLTNDSLYFSSGDAELVEHWQHRAVHTDRVNYRIVDGRLRTWLRHYGLWGHSSRTKFIPRRYLENSVDVRLALLQGLMDCDGHAMLRGGIDYLTASKQLALDVVELVRSLGGFVNEPKIKRAKGYDWDYWRMNIRFDSSSHFNPFRLERKKSLFKYTLTTQIIRDITYEGEQATRCIQVEAIDQLYLTEAFKVTHNTYLAAQAVNPVIIACPVNESVTLAKLPNARDIRILACTHWGDVIDTVKVLQRPSEKLGPFDSIVFDNLTHAYGFAVEHALSKQSNDVVSQATWTAANRLMRDVLDDLLAIQGKNVILVAHHRREKNDRTGDIQVLLDFGPSLAQSIMGRLNACFYYRLVGEQRKLTVSSAPGVDVKSRYDLGRDLTNPRWDDVMDLLDKYKAKILKDNPPTKEQTND